MFDIAFTATEPERQDDGWFGLAGRTTLGDYRETFLAPMWPWARADYERQWREAAERLLGGAESTAFFTTAFRFWWVMWRVGEIVIVHEEFLTPDLLAALGPSPDIRRTPYELLYPLETHNEDGQELSAWHLRLSDVADFLARQGSGAAS